MRSATQWSHQSGIDSRSHLTYMRNMGVNELIRSAQKSSVPLARLKLEAESAVSFSSGPVLPCQDRDYQGSASVSSSHRRTRCINKWLAEITVDRTRSRCLINRYKFHLPEYSLGGISSTSINIDIFCYLNQNNGSNVFHPQLQHNGL